MKIRICDIDAIAPQRPPGYKEQLMALATTQTSDWIEVDQGDYDRLWYNYRIVPAVPPMEERTLANYFDRVVVINLDRRPDRMEELDTEMKRVEWPFRQPQRLRATDANKVPPHHGWTAGGGAWGCMQSHRRILEEALMDDVHSLLVLEDDVMFVPDFREKVEAFIKNVPLDWDQLMLGGQYINRDSRHSFRKRVAPGVYKVGGCERTHAYALRGRGIRDLYVKWCGSVGHCDHVMGPWQHDFNVYAPDHFLAGQRQGKSDISGSDNAAKLWVPPRPDAPVWYLKGPVEVLEGVRNKGFHSGRMRTAGVDKGLAAIVDSKELLAVKVARLRAWISMIQWEGRSMTPECDCLIYHPGISDRLVRLATGKHLRIIEAATPAEFFEKVKWPA